METRPTWLTGVAVVLLCQIGCAGEGSGPAPSDEDVVTVLSASPRLGPSGWGLSPEPIMQLGRVEGGGADLFDQVGDLLVLPDGTLLVANRGDNTIRFFQADGEFVRSIGGTGDGPGEFRFLAGVESLGDEILGIPFFLTRPVQVFDMQGDYIRTIRASLPADNPALTMQGTFSDGSLLAVRIPQGRPVEEGLYTQQSEIYLLDPAEGTTTQVLTMPGRRFVDTGGIRGHDQEYGLNLVVSGRGERFYVGWPETYEIDARRRDGTLEYRIRAEIPLRPVRSADKEALRVAALASDTMTSRGGVPVQSSQQRLRELDRMIYPENHPAYQSFEIDEEGNLWVNRHWGPVENPVLQPRLSAGITWDVFDRDGAWVTTLFTPPGFWPRWFGRDRVAGVWRDELGVDYVRVYSLQK